MNGAMFQDRIAAFRVIPYEAWQAIPIPANIHKFIDVSPETLADLMNNDQSSSNSRVAKKYKGKDLLFDKVRLRVKPEDFEESETSKSELDEEEEPFGLDSESEDEGPRVSKRLQKQAAVAT